MAERIDLGEARIGNAAALAALDQVQGRADGLRDRITSLANSFNEVSDAAGRVVDHVRAVAERIAEFDNFARAVQRAGSALDRVTEATQGLASAQQAAALRMALLRGGIQATDEQLASFAARVVQTARDTGQSVDSAMDSVQDALVEGSPEAFANLGLAMDGAATRAQQFASAVEQIDRVAADTGNVRTFGESLQLLGDNTKLIAGGALALGFAPLLPLVHDLADATGTVARGLASIYEALTRNEAQIRRQAAAEARLAAEARRRDRERLEDIQLQTRALESQIATELRQLALRSRVAGSEGTDSVGALRGATEARLRSLQSDRAAAQARLNDAAQGDLANPRALAAYNTAREAVQQLERQITGAQRALDNYTAAQARAENIAYEVARAERENQEAVDAYAQARQRSTENDLQFRERQRQLTARLAETDAALRSVREAYDAAQGAATSLSGAQAALNDVLSAGLPTAEQYQQALHAARQIAAHNANRRGLQDQLRRSLAGEFRGEDLSFLGGGGGGGGSGPSAARIRELRDEMGRLETAALAAGLAAEEVFRGASPRRGESIDAHLQRRAQQLNDLIGRAGELQSLIANLPEPPGDNRALDDRKQTEEDMRRSTDEFIANQRAAEETRRIELERASDFGRQIQNLFATTQTGAQAMAASVQQAFQGATQALGQHAVAWLTGRETIGEAATGMMKDVLAALTQEAIVKSVFQLAEGFASLAATMGVPNPKSASHFAAAAIYGATAVAAGGALAAVSAASAPAAGGAPQSTGRPVGAPAAGASRDAEGVTLVFNTSGAMFNEGVEDAIVRGLDRAAQRGVLPRSLRQAAARRTA